MIIQVSRSNSYSLVTAFHQVRFSGSRPENTCPIGSLSRFPPSRYLDILARQNPRVIVTCHPHDHTQEFPARASPLPQASFSHLMLLDALRSCRTANPHAGGQVFFFLAFSCCRLGISTSRCRANTTEQRDAGSYTPINYIGAIGPVHLSYNPYFSACFFSQNSIFLSQQISRESISICFFSEANEILFCFAE